MFWEALTEKCNCVWASVLQRVSAVWRRAQYTDSNAFLFNLPKCNCTCIIWRLNRGPVCVIGSAAVLSPNCCSFHWWRPTGSFRKRRSSKPNQTDSTYCILISSHLKGCPPPPKIPTNSRFKQSFCYIPCTSDCTHANVNAQKCPPVFFFFFFSQQHEWML